MTELELERLLHDRASQLRELCLSELPRERELPDYPTSRRFDRKIARLIRRAGRAPWQNAALRGAYQAAVVALVAVTVTFSGLMVTSEAFRAQVLAVVTQMYEDITHFRFYAQAEGEETVGHFTLTWLPEGMVEVERKESSHTLHLFFEDQKGRSLEITRVAIGEKTVYSYGLDTEDTEVEHFQISGEPATAVEKKGVCTIVWTHESSVFVVSGTISMEEARQIAVGLE